MPTGRYVLRARPAGSGRVDYEAELNAAQLEAVRHHEGPALVIAGAGSGKTRTLVYRVARLVESGVPPTSILLLTFTRRASREMLDRASALVGADCGRVAGGTFHSFANTVLRKHAGDLGREGAFTILDRSDTEDVLQFLRASLGFDRKERRFPKKGTIASLFSASVNRATPLTELVEREYPHLSEYEEDFARLAARYEAYKREKNLLDYDDLLLFLRELLETRPEAARRLGERYRFVMVDEYQDTNHLQAEIVERLVAPHRNVVAVGDDAQSIYSFRGADFRNIMEFPKRFPEAKIIALEENYRSTQPILDLANAVIDRAVEKYTKILRVAEPGKRPGNPEPPLLVRAGNENDQSRFVCQRVLELREEGVPLDDIAVLFRSGFHSFDLEIELARADIPFVKRGGFRFAEAAHVKDLLAHVRILENPRDAVSWIRALVLLEGVGAKTAARMAERMAEGEDPESVLLRSGWRGSREAFEALHRCLDEARRVREEPVAVIERILRYYQPILERHYRDDHPRRARDLDHLATLAARYGSLEPMLTDFALEPPSDAVGGSLATDEESGTLTLSTIHSAKGLEWHAVFLLWAADGRFPAFHATTNPESLEEERRLAYVAVTRAERLLYVTYPVEYYDRATGSIFGSPSRFFEALPEDVLPPVAVVEEPV